MTDVRYGDNSRVAIELDDGRVANEVGTLRAEPLDNARAATATAVREPLEFPPLAQCVTPADRVVLALDRGLPEAASIVLAVVEALVEAGVAADGITVLRSPGDQNAGANDPCQLLPSPLRERITVATHDPADRRQLAYLAANEAGEAILVNRAIHEADMILSIGCLRGDHSAGYFGIHDCVYPSFSDEKTLQRFRGLGSLQTSGKDSAKSSGGERSARGKTRPCRHDELVAEANNAAWLLGVNFTVQVVPAGGERVMHVLAGHPDAVQERGRELYHTAWDWPVSLRADLVVAALEGGAGQQTWENVGRALQVAGQFVEEGGAIAVCCGLSAQPGPGIQSLAHADSREAALRHISHHRPIDALAAAQLASALDRGKVYLLSQLDPSLVEDLEMIPVAGPDELARLARHHSSCVLLSNAPYVVAKE
ncbi:MAG: lactate racemase domain-containing protein [Thermoguttaceae bacterium]